MELSPDGQAVTQQQTLLTSDALDVITGPGGAIVGIDLSGDSIKVFVPDDAGVSGMQAYDIFPWRAPAGREFVIGGVGFGSLEDTTVSIGSDLAEISYVSDTRIKGILPTLSTTTTDLLDVTVNSGSVSSTITDAFLPLTLA
jgi:hypothetical protein